MGIEAAATNERTVAGWNALLRANRERFPVPDPKTHKQNKPLPNLLEYFRETLPWIEYCVRSLADLTVEQARNERADHDDNTKCYGKRDSNDKQDQRG